MYLHFCDSKKETVISPDTIIQLDLGSCDRASWAKCEEIEKTNKMQQLDVCNQLLSQHVSGIIMPIFRRTKTVLLHMLYCAGSDGCGWERLWGVAL